jgi:hypothetical protein
MEYYAYQLNFIIWIVFCVALFLFKFMINDVIFYSIFLGIEAYGVKIHCTLNSSLLGRHA